MPRSFGAVGGDRACARAREPVDDRARFGGRVAEEHARAGEQGAGGRLHAAGVHAAERQGAEDVVQADDAELAVQHLPDRRARLARALCARDGCPTAASAASGSGTSSPARCALPGIGTPLELRSTAFGAGSGAPREIRIPAAAAPASKQRKRHPDRQRPRQRVATRRRRLAKPTEALAECVERS